MTILISTLALALYWSSAIVLFRVEARMIDELRESVRSIHETEV